MNKTIKNLGYNTIDYSLNNEMLVCNINVNNLSKGIYFVNVKIDGILFKEKLIVQ